MSDRELYELLEQAGSLEALRQRVMDATIRTCRQRTSVAARKLGVDRCTVWRRKQRLLAEEQQ
jgi:transcriptional regulator of acetoin/glycerol metabolism